jgi:hypothetical protein
MLVSSTSVIAGLTMWHARQQYIRHCRLNHGLYFAGFYDDLCISSFI